MCPTGYVPPGILICLDFFLEFWLNSDKGGGTNKEAGRHNLCRSVKKTKAKIEKRKGLEKRQGEK